MSAEGGQVENISHRRKVDGCLLITDGETGMRDEESEEKVSFFAPVSCR